MDFKKFFSLIIGFLAGFVVLALMIALDNLFSFSDSSALYPILGFGLSVLVGYIVNKIFYFVSIPNPLELLCDLISKALHANKDKSKSSRKDENETLSAGAKIPFSEEKRTDPDTSAHVSDSPVSTTRHPVPSSNHNPVNDVHPDVPSQIVQKEEHPIAIPSIVTQPSEQNTNRNKRYYPYFPSVLDGIPLVYYYRNNLISDIDSFLFDAMIDSDDYFVDVIHLNNGGTELRKHGKRLGTIQKYGKMVSDWITRGDPIVCKITVLSEGKEAVGIGFYKDMESKLRSCKCNVVRLTNNRSEDMQISVSCLSDGEMLNFFPDYVEEYSPIPVQSMSGGEVGFLPKRFNKIHDDSGIRGVFVDHVDEIETDNGDYKYIAYARVYWD